MSFEVRIYFMGLIAFVPEEDGGGLTVLLLDARNGYAISDGTWLEPHRPLLVSRAGHCVGQCGIGDPSIAGFLFPDAGADGAAERLSAAVLEGAAWQLGGSELSLALDISEADGVASPLQILGNARRLLAGRAASLPASAAERQDFSWVADLNRIDSSVATADPDVLAPRPQKGLIAARLRLEAGTVGTFRLVGVGDEVVPIHFRTLHSEAVRDGYVQALADSVVVAIRAPGETLEVVEVVEGEERRTMTLAPRDGLLEIAVLNLPASHFLTHSQHGAAHADGATEGAAHDDSGHPITAIPAVPEEPLAARPGPGKHFEMYYELAAMRPPNRLRPVPYQADQPGVAWSSVHPRDELYSDLLTALGLGDPRGAYDRIICPLAQFSAQE